MWVVLVRNGMFLLKTNPQIWLPFFLLCNRYHVYRLMENNWQNFDPIWWWNLPKVDVFGRTWCSTWQWSDPLPPPVGKILIGVTFENSNFIYSKFWHSQPLYILQRFVRKILKEYLIKRFSRMTWGHMWWLMSQYSLRYCTIYCWWDLESFPWNNVHWRKL